MGKAIHGGVCESFKTTWRCIRNRFWYGILCYSYEEVIKKFNKWRLKQKNKKIKLIKGLWQYTVPSLNKKYDCIFFDDSPSHELNRNNNDRFNLFLKLILNKNVKYNSKLVCYAIGRSIFTGYLTKHFTQEYYKYNIKVPYFCKYAKGDFMGVSKIIFKKQN